MGLLGLLLSVVGVYGVVSYGASLRTREMGIRIALGAQPRNVRGLVLRQGSVLVIAGIVCGLAVAVGGHASALEVLRPRRHARRPDVRRRHRAPRRRSRSSACYLPARRAMRVDPMVALRHE